MVGLLEGAGVAGAASAALSAAGGCGVFFGAALADGADDSMLAGACFTTAEAAPVFAELVTAGFFAAAGVFFAATAAGLAAGFAAVVLTLLAAGLLAALAGFAGLVALGAGFTVFLTAVLAALPAVLAATFLAGAAAFFTALAPRPGLPLAAAFFAVLPVLFAISVHRCG
ncbi:hypothetical protein NM961_03050 [Tahibacter sp. P2K]|uniref:Uncharacterized protein n=1 Tax=Tahibacter harae TaxID=2963937 RepID=A0ABT1QP23_9GAMM|nr:hypothetical protein [Tahibacter harae]MCQ4163682.1 hypothetical protein [Tahibacter harae]